MADIQITKTMHAPCESGSVAEWMRDRLETDFSPCRLKIEDRSTDHIGHAGYKEGGETHFHIEIVSDRFVGLSSLSRHRYVYQTLAPALAQGVHALSLSTLTFSESRLKAG